MSEKPKPVAYLWTIAGENLPCAVTEVKLGKKKAPDVLGA